MAGTFTSATYGLFEGTSFAEGEAEAANTVAHIFLVNSSIAEQEAFALHGQEAEFRKRRDVHIVRGSMAGDGVIIQAARQPADAVHSSFGGLEFQGQGLHGS